MPQPRSRQVRAFISSTFRDMQAERDHLMRVVFPELEQRCMARGLPFVPVDLRWGVTQAEAESGETLAICLQEIEECRPFFLCLLGERYGWTPLPPEVEGEHARRLSGGEARLFAETYYENEGYDEFLLRTERQRQETWGEEREGYEQKLLGALVRAGVPSAGQSITAQEIYHGVLGDPEQMAHSLFYFRDAALTKKLAGAQPQGFYEITAEGQEKLAALKQSITGAGLRPQAYDGIECLGQLALDQLWERITQEFPDERQAPPDPLSEERQAQELFVQRLTRFFVGRDETLVELDGLVAQGDGYVALTGPSGCGKTALLVNWLYGREGFVAKHPGTFVLSHFIGASTRSANAREILSRLCQELASLAEWTEELPLDLNELSGTFPNILEAAARRQPILIVIDALDQLEQTDNAHSLNWLPGTLPEGVALVASSLGGSGEPQEEEHRTWPPLQSRAGERLVRVPLFERPAAEKMVVDYLDQFRHHLSPEQLAALTDKAEIGSPLYLQVALNELLTFGEYERVTEYLHALPGTLPAMYECVLEHLEREHGQTFVARVMSCLACGRYGMTEQELLALTPNPSPSGRGVAEGRGEGVTPLKWGRLYRILSPHLLKRGEALGFYHRQLREAVERRYLPDEERMRQTHADIAGYFEGQPLTNKRKLEEQPFQQTLGQLWEALLGTLTDYRFLDAKLRGVSVQDLIEDYERAGAAEMGLEEDGARSLRLIGGTLRLSAHVLARDPDQLPSQLWGRLVGSEDAAIQSLLGSAKESMVSPWLRALTASLTPPGGPLLRTLTGHSKSVYAVAVTPDGRCAVSASEDQTLKLWDLESGAELRTLTGHGSGVTAVAVTADGRRAVSGSWEGTLKVWDLESGAELRTLAGHRYGVTRVSVTADGRRAVSGSWEGALKVWDLESGAELHTLTAHSEWLSAVAVAADGRRAVSASRDQTLKVWDLESGAELHTLTGHSDWATAVAVTADGRRAVSASRDQTLKVWDLESGAELRTLSGHSGWVNAVAVTADGRRAVSASHDQTLKVWDLESGAELRTLTGDGAGGSALAVTADGHRAVSAYGQTLRVWDLASGAELRTRTAHSGWTTAVAVTADGHRAVSASYDMTLKVWDLASGAELRTLAGHSDWVLGVAVAADGRRAVSASSDQTLKVWDLESGAALRTLTGHGAGVRAVAVTADGRRAVSASLDKTLKVWDLESGAKLRTLTGHAGWFMAVAVTADGRRAVSASEDTTLKVWDLESGAKLRTLAEHRDWVVAVAVAPDGSRAVSASEDNTLKVWDLESGAELRTLTGHSAGVWAAVVTADGRRVVSGSVDQTLKVWDLERGLLLSTFSADAGLSACAVAPDGLTFIAGDAGGHVHFLRLENVTPGLPICTAWHSPDDDTPAFGCLHCRVWSEVPASALGTELPCPHCGKAVQLNPFVIEADWRPIAAAWRGDT